MGRALLSAARLNAAVRDALPALVTWAALGAVLVLGPIEQLPGYNAFADTRALLGVPNAADVVSNAGFALVGLWGLARAQASEAPREARPALLLYFAALVATAAGSAYYHLAPDNARLVWDRLPIALACAGLLAGARAQTVGDGRGCAWTAALAALGVLAVLWWRFTDLAGRGDLGPYLLLQALPLVLVPLWDARHGSARGLRVLFAAAVCFYVLAKAAELHDAALLSLTGVSGHTLKHLLATAAALLLGLRLLRSGPARGGGRAWPASFPSGRSNW